jgi:hypothetical protein
MSAGDDGRRPLELNDLMWSVSGPLENILMPAQTPRWAVVWPELIAARSA